MVYPEKLFLLGQECVTRTNSWFGDLKNHLLLCLCQILEGSSWNHQSISPFYFLLQPCLNFFLDTWENIHLFVLDVGRQTVIYFLWGESFQSSKFQVHYLDYCFSKLPCSEHQGSKYPSGIWHCLIKNAICPVLIHQTQAFCPVLYHWVSYVENPLS